MPLLKVDVVDCDSGNILQICTGMLHYTRMLIHVHTVMYALHIYFVKLPGTTKI
jgi:hypothetical protein